MPNAGARPLGLDGATMAPNEVPCLKNTAAFRKAMTREDLHSYVLGRAALQYLSLISVLTKIRNRMLLKPFQNIPSRRTVLSESGITDRKRRETSRFH